MLDADGNETQRTEERTSRFWIAFPSPHDFYSTEVRTAVDAGSPDVLNARHWLMLACLHTCQRFHLFYIRSRRDEEIDHELCAEWKSLDQTARFS